jgi:hypothetical protein
VKKKRGGKEEGSEVEVEGEVAKLYRILHFRYVADLNSLFV